MKKHVLTLSIFSLTLMIAPIFSGANANAAIDIIDVDEKEPLVNFSGRTMHVDNAQGEVVYIYDIRGVMIVSYKITSQSQRIDLNNLPKGCYLVKVGKTVRKVSLK